ncbi:hypothetical protein PENTCL1PPCAC_6072, partial [Pristionchus entomophagus]
NAVSLIGSVPHHSGCCHVLHPLHLLRFRRAGFPLLQGQPGSYVRDYGSSQLLHVREKFDIPPEVRFRQFIGRGTESGCSCCCSLHDHYSSGSGGLFNSILETTHLCCMIYPTVSLALTQVFLSGPSHSVRSPL